MIEYLYNAIRAVAGQDIEVSAVIKDAEGAVIPSDCYLVVHLDGEMLRYEGDYIQDLGFWSFTVPAAATMGKTGHHEYCIMHDDENLCFRQPLYLV